VRTAATAARTFLAIGLGILALLSPSSSADAAPELRGSRPTTQNAIREVALASGERVLARLDMECKEGRLEITLVLTATRTVPASRSSALRGNVVAFDTRSGSRVERRSWPVSWTPDTRPWTWAVPETSSWLRPEPDADLLVFHPDRSAPVKDEVVFIPRAVDWVARKATAGCRQENAASEPEPREWTHAGDEPPQAISKVSPVYPQAARDQRVQGTVIIRALIDTEGSVAQAAVLTSIPGLDEAAIESVRQWRFRPARSGGKPLAVWMSIPIRFSLH
jgi:TonB family protein